MLYIAPISTLYYLLSQWCRLLAQPCPRLPSALDCARAPSTAHAPPTPDADQRRSPAPSKHGMPLSVHSMLLLFPDFRCPLHHNRNVCAHRPSLPETVVVSPSLPLPAASPPMFLAKIACEGPHPKFVASCPRPPATMRQPAAPAPPMA